MGAHGHLYANTAITISQTQERVELPTSCTSAVWQHDTIQFSAGSLIVVGFTTSGGRDETGCPVHVTGAYPENCEDSIDGSLCTLTCPDPPSWYSTYVAAGEYMPTGHDGAVQCYDGDWNVPDPTAETTEPAFPYCQFVGTSFDDLGHAHAPGKSAPGKSKGKSGKAYTGKAVSAGTVDGSTGWWNLVPISKKKKNKNKRKGDDNAAQMTGDSKIPPKNSGFLSLVIGICVGLVAINALVIALVRKRRHQDNDTISEETSDFVGPSSTSEAGSESHSPPSLCELASRANALSVADGTWDTHGEPVHSDVDNDIEIDGVASAWNEALEQRWLKGTAKGGELQFDLLEDINTPTA